MESSLNSILNSIEVLSSNAKKMKKKYIVVKQMGKANATFKVTNPKKIKFWRMIAERVSGSVGLIKTEIIEEGFTND